MRRLLPLFLLLAVAACGSDATPTTVTSSAPFSSVDIVMGTGAATATGKSVTVTYALWLYDSTKTDGKGTSVPQPTGPYGPFVVGVGAVIAGWDQGLPGMKVGGQRRLVIPPELAYGSSGSGSIPPNATLVFDITLLSTT
ncbi:MAG TPA: FKBP-type peptidyl-prolyl cis-trans isomerase [Vicinamibacterales bacterium]|jgi:FKBP-type peptidyl-prolyl cis-trans isomerase